MPNWVPLNWDIMRHPVNWIIVFLMVVIAGIALDVLSQWAASVKSPAIEE
jgi:hypothetical protein